ncbi:SPARK domain [Dillenia turbinata]|uniref:SPARK domain n=1 Tax=Dillenia turbinata TaxID=194707 RepID=A0AAN8ZL62_9MAGN
MMIKFIVLFSLLSLSSSSASTTNTTSPASCPMDLSYVLRIPWNTSGCENYKNSSASSSCCQTLLSLYGIALSEHLKETSNFNLPDIPTSISCLSSFQSYLNKLSLPSNLTSLCFDPLQFVITPNFCASIETKSDWINKLGTSTVLDSACRPDLTDMTLCDACVGAAYKVQSQLVAMDGNSSHATNCFYLAVLYAAGIVNEFGPQSNGAITCMFSIPITSEMGSHSEPHLLLVFGLTSAGAGKIDEVLDASLLRGGDVSGSSYPRGIMERFVLVGILCAHVMVALRPTILDALKMLEGDIEVPNIPDRPASLLHPSVYGDANTFSISPALSRPQLQAGEMLRCPLVPHDEITWWNVEIENSHQLDCHKEFDRWSHSQSNSYLELLELKRGKWKGQ